MKPVGSYLLAGACALVVAVLGAFTMLFFGLFRSPPRPLYNEPPALQVYDVPADRAREIRDALDVVLSSGAGKDKTIGRAMLSGNQLLVLAPRDTQETVAAAVKKLGGDPAKGASQARPMRLSLWLVDVLPGASAADESLAAIAPALDAARPGLGAVHFALHDALSLSLLTDGHPVTMNTPRGSEIGAQLRPGDKGATAELNIRGGEAGLVTTTWLREGQTVVLAQLLAPDKANERARLYVVRLDPIDAG